MVILLRRIIKWIVDNAFDILGFIGLQSFITLFSCVYKLINESSWTKLEIVLLIVLTIEIITFIIVYCVKRFAWFSYQYPTGMIGTNYIINRKTVHYKRDAQDRLIFSREIEIKSQISDLESIFDKYIWTGKMLADTPYSRNKKCSIREENVVGIWRYFRISLDQHLKKGQTSTISYQWPTIDDCSNSSAFVSADTDIPTKELIFKVDLGVDFAGVEAKLEEFRAIESDCPIHTETIRFGPDGSYVWNVKHIRRFRYYRVRWSWNRSSVIQIPTNNKE